MPAVFPRSELVGMAAMRFIQAPAPQHPACERHARIDDEHAEQDEPRPEERGVDPRRQHAGDRHHEAEKAAAGVAEEDAGRRIVPAQKTGHRGQQQRGNAPRRIPGAADGKENDLACADRCRLDAGDAVDAVHEVVEVDEPDDADDSEDVDRHRRDAGQQFRRNAAQPVQRPCRGQNVQREPPTGRDVAVVVEQADQRHRAAAAQHRREEPLVRNAEPRGDHHAQRERQDNRHAAAARHGMIVRAAHVREIQQPALLCEAHGHPGQDEGHDGRRRPQPVNVHRRPSRKCRAVAASA